MRKPFRNGTGCAQPANLVLHPAGEAHADNFGKEGGACFNVESSQAWLQRAGAANSSHIPNIISDPSTVGLAARLRQEFLFLDDVSSIECDLIAHRIKGYGAVIMTNGDAGGALIQQLRRIIQREYKWDALDLPIPRRYGPE
jgi:hypothetical protein